MQHHPDVRPTKDADIFHVAMNMRRSDVQEVRASSGRDPEEALCDAMEHTVEPLTYAPNGKAAAIFGVIPFPDMPMVGAPWLLGTDEFPKQLRQIALFTSQYIDHIARDFTQLLNVVDERNEVHVRWLQWAGFRFTHRHELWGFEKRPFLQFEKLYV